MDYEQKRSIIKHFSTAEHWTNIFNDAFFADEARKWHSTTQGAITISRSPSGRRYKITDTENGRSLLIRKGKTGRIKVKDEHGRRFIMNQGRVTSRGDIISDVRPITSTSEFGLDGNLDRNKAHIASINTLGILIRFHKNGSKSVFFENLGHRVEMTSGGIPLQNIKGNGRFFHRISINEDNIRQWDIPPAYAMMFAKLVVARDFNIEPAIGALNTLDEEKAIGILLRHLKNPHNSANEQRSGIIAAENEWHDTTEFEGHRVDTARKFSITRTDHGYDFATTSTQKHAILSQGALLTMAERADILTIQAVNARTTTKAVLHMLKNGNAATDHLKQNWKFVVLDSPAALKVVTAMKDTAINELDLRADRFAAITFDHTKSLLAIEENALTEVASALENSLKSLH